VYLFSNISAGPGGFVSRLILVVGMSVDGLDDRELESSTSHGESLSSLDILRVQCHSSDDLDSIRLSSVVTSHLLV